MTSQKEVKMLEKVLNLPEVIIKGYQKIEGVGWTFRVESECQEAICPRCGGTSRNWLFRTYGDKLGLLKQAS
jgi:hypothetical protein